MFNARIQRPGRRALPLLMLLLLAILVLRKFIARFFQGEILEAHAAPPKPVALVFGAGLRYDGQPSAILADRVSTAVALYRQGKVESLLMSGSIRAPDYDEPQAMRAFALSMGIPDEVIQLDRGGTRTFISCLRAKQEFNVNQALLVSQSFHLPRALAICHGLGIQAVGVRADLRPYNLASQRYWELREIPAMFLALWDITIARAHSPSPTIDHPNPIQPGRYHGT